MSNILPFSKTHKKQAAAMKLTDCEHSLDVFALLSATERGRMLVGLTPAAQFNAALALQPVMALGLFLASSDTGRELLQREKLVIAIAGCESAEMCDKGAWFTFLRELTGYQGELKVHLSGPNLDKKQKTGLQPPASKDVVVDGDIALAGALRKIKKTPDLVFIAHPGLIDFGEGWYGVDGLASCPPNTPLLFAGYSIDEVCADRLFHLMNGGQVVATPFLNRLALFRGDRQLNRMTCAFRYLWQALPPAAVSKPRVLEGMIGFCRDYEALLMTTAVSCTIFEDNLLGAPVESPTGQPAFYLGAGLQATVNKARQASLERAWNFEGERHVLSLPLEFEEERFSKAVRTVALAAYGALPEGCDEGARCDLAALEALTARGLIKKQLEATIGDKKKYTAGVKALKNPTELQKLLAEDPFLPLRHKDGVTLLHLAAESDLVEAVKLLMAHGADPNACDRVDVWTPLLHAADNENSELCLWMVQHGANRYTPVGMFGPTMLVDLVEMRRGREMRTTLEEMRDEVPEMSY